MLRSLIAVLSSLALGNAFSQTVHAGPILGSDLQATYLSPNQATIFAGPVTATVGAGVEFQNNPIAFQPSAFGSFEIDISSSTIRLELVESPPSDSYSLSFIFFPASFRGLKLLDVNGTIDPFLSVTVNPATNVPGFAASRITFTDDEILVNLQGLTFTTGVGLADPGTALILLDLAVGGSTSTPVPEPGTFLLWGSVTLAGIGWQRLRRG